VPHVKCSGMIRHSGMIKCSGMIRHSGMIKYSGMIRHSGVIKYSGVEDLIKNNGIERCDIM
jgi:hypothetical protein